MRAHAVEADRGDDADLRRADHRARAQHRLARAHVLAGAEPAELGTALAELFPTAVRYTGASLAFNCAGILGGSLAPYIATWLAVNYGISAVGYYLSAAGVLTLGALLLIHWRTQA